MGNYLTDKLFNVCTYGIAGSGIVVNFGDIKAVLLFLGAMILLVLQIVLHIIKIRNERKSN